MKIEFDKINELCLPYMKRPKRIIGAKVVVLTTIRNKAGDVIERGEVCEIITSHRGYGIKAPGENGERPREIHRVSHYDVRFLKEPKAGQIDFTGAEGNEYTLFDECDDPCPPVPPGAFVLGKPAPIILTENVVEEILSIAGDLRETYPEMSTAELSELILDRMTVKK